MRKLVCDVGHWFQTFAEALFEHFIGVFVNRKDHGAVQEMLSVVEFSADKLGGSGGEGGPAQKKLSPLVATVLFRRKISLPYTALCVDSR